MFSLPTADGSKRKFEFMRYMETTFLAIRF